MVSIKIQLVDLDQQRRYTSRMSNPSESILTEAIRELEMIVQEFDGTIGKQATDLFRRMVIILDRPPLSKFLENTSPNFDVNKWYSEDAQIGQNSGMLGSQSLRFPVDLRERIEARIALIGSLAEDFDFDSFVITYFNAGPGTDECVSEFIKKFLRPFLRDFRQLAKTSHIPGILLEGLGGFPSSGDTKLDLLLQEACDKFRDPAATTEATEKLWDAWERLKTIDEPANKQASTGKLLGHATTIPELIELLEVESRALTKIGNDFHIRHFEANRTPIEPPRFYNYLFHRLYALIHLLLSSRQITTLE